MQEGIKLLKSVSISRLFQTFITRLVKNKLHTDLVQLGSRNRVTGWYNFRNGTAECSDCLVPDFTRIW